VHPLYRNTTDLDTAIGTPFAYYSPTTSHQPVLHVGISQHLTRSHLVGIAIQQRATVMHLLWAAHISATVSAVLEVSTGMSGEVSRTTPRREPTH